MTVAKLVITWRTQCVPAVRSVNEPVYIVMVHPVINKILH
jgi:hypothetical protein